MINFKQLRAFHEVARLQNFSAAARALRVTQPAVTAHVRALENSLGVQLLRRRGRKIALTEAGTVLFLQAREVFELERSMEQTVGEMRRLERGVLSIGTTRTYAQHLMPPLITRFHAKYPAVRTVMQEGTSLEICRSLLDLRNELAVVAHMDGMKQLTFVPFRTESVLLVAAPEHELATRGSVIFEELAEWPFIMREEGSGVQSLTRACFDDRGLSPHVVIETGNVEFIKEMVERGEAVSFLVESSVSSELDRGTLAPVEVTDQELTLDVNIAYLEGNTFSPAAEAFLNLLLESAGSSSA